MLLLDRQRVSVVANPGGSGPVHLRLREDGALIELPLGKTTIGSSPRCNVRLQKPGVQPLHCLIVHGSEGLSARRWAPDTRLNGAPFTDGPLTTGDCLTLGGVELEVVTSTPSLVPDDVRNAQFPAAVTSCDILMNAVQESVEKITELDEGSAVSEYEVLADVLECEHSRVVKAVQDVSADNDAAEAVFRELQAACAAARGRARKMLAALRRERKENRELLARLAGIASPFAQATEPREHGIVTQQPDDLGTAEWKTQLVELQRQFAAWENRLAELTDRLAGVERELAAMHAAEVLSPPPVGAAESIASLDEATSDNELNASVKSLAAHTDWRLPRSTEAPSEIGWQRDEVADVGESSRPAAGLLAAAPPAAAIEEPVEAWPPVATEPQVSAVDEWPTPRREPASDWATNSAAAAFVAVDEQPSALVDDAAWGHSAHGNSATETSPPSPALPVLEPPADLWSSMSDTRDSELDAELRGTTSPDEIEVDQPAWAQGKSNTPVDEVDELSPFAEFSIWRQGANDEPANSVETGLGALESPADGLTAWGSISVDQEVANVEVATEAQAQPNAQAAVTNGPQRGGDSSAHASSAAANTLQTTSFIERYAHLFDEAQPDQTNATGGPRATVATEAASAMSPAHGMVRNAVNPEAATAAEDEESIEQYMAKLLQRVRGEPDVSVVPQASLKTVAAPKSVDTGTIAAEPSIRPSSVVPAAEAPAVAPGPGEESPVKEDADWDGIARRAAAAAPATDLGALRALANESARRAIGRHQLKVHRRDAVTKVIVSSLAGMTSLWLMLDAPNWQDIQFITACVALLAAAYWAGETFREMLESLKAAAYDGPQNIPGDAGPENEMSLPIDIDP